MLGCFVAWPARGGLRGASLRCRSGCGRVPTDALGPVWGDGGIASSAQDLAPFTEALFAGELVSAQTLGEMVARRSRFGRKAGYGLGVMTTKAPAGCRGGARGLVLRMDVVDRHR